MSADSPPHRLWLPLHWPSWLAVAVLRLAALLPLEAGLAIGRWLGRIAFFLVPVRRAVTEKNLALCFPELAPRARRRLARQCHESFGMGIFEAVFALFASAPRFAGRATLEGWEQVQALQAAGRGAILLSVHLHTMEIAGRFVCLQGPMSAFYRNPKNPVFARVREGRHQHILTQMFAIDDLKGAVRALREGHLLWYAPDQGRRFKATVLAPFFGIPAVTNAATGKIAQLGRAAIVPWSAIRERRAGRWHYRVRFLPPLQLPADDAEAEATSVNCVVEAIVCQAPEQYLWQHKRFKARGAGFPDEYAGLR